ncbi:MAG: DUF192 domain-containing protein [Limisphaerales bacterium]
MFRAFALTAALLAGWAATGGCDRPPASAAAAPPPSHLDDGRPLAGLPRLKLLLGAKELDAEVAMTVPHIMKGLMWRTNVAETAGMLFVFGQTHQPAFYMKNVPMDIDCAYLDPAGTILEIHRLERFNTNPVPARAGNIQFVLETAAGWFARHGVATGMVVRTETGPLRDSFRFAR